MPELGSHHLDVQCLEKRETSYDSYGKLENWKKHSVFDDGQRAKVTYDTYVTFEVHFKYFLTPAWTLQPPPWCPMLGEKEQIKIKTLSATGNKTTLDTLVRFWWFRLLAAVCLSQGLRWGNRHGWYGWPRGPKEDKKAALGQAISEPIQDIQVYQLQSQSQKSSFETTQRSAVQGPNGPRPKLANTSNAQPANYPCQSSSVRLDPKSQKTICSFCPRTQFCAERGCQRWICWGDEANGGNLEGHDSFGKGTFREAKHARVPSPAFCHDAPWFGYTAKATNATRSTSQPCPKSK